MPSCVPVPRKLSSSSFEARGVLAALAAEGNSRVESPHVLRRDFDVDDAVVERHGPDQRIAQVARVAQDARRLFEQAGAVQIAAVETAAGLRSSRRASYVQAIAEARQRGVFVGAFDIEQIARVEVNVADARALRFELRVAGQARRARRFGLRRARLDAGQDSACAPGSAARGQGKP